MSYLIINLNDNSIYYEAASIIEAQHNKPPYDNYTIMSEIDYYGEDYE